MYVLWDLTNCWNVLIWHKHTHTHTWWRLHNLTTELLMMLYFLPFQTSIRHHFSKNSSFWVSSTLPLIFTWWSTCIRSVHPMSDSGNWHGLNILVSHGSVATRLRCGRKYSQGFVVSTLLSAKVKEFSKLANCCQSYEIKSSGKFLFDSCCSNITM